MHIIQLDDYVSMEITKMATQIATTPIIKGTEAKKVYTEANRLPSKKARDGAKNYRKSLII